MRGGKSQRPVTSYMASCMFTKTLLLLSRLVRCIIDQKVVMCTELKLISKLNSRKSKFNFPRSCCALGSRVLCVDLVEGREHEHILR